MAPLGHQIVVALYLVFLLTIGLKLKSNNVKTALTHTKISPRVAASEVATLAVRDFVRVEKNLSTMGFFTPSKSRSQGELREKVIRFRRDVGGKTIDRKSTRLNSSH